MVYLYLEVVGAVCCSNVLGEYGSRVLYRDISSGGNSTARCVFGCLDELASRFLMALYILKPSSNRSPNIFYTCSESKNRTYKKV